MFVSPMLLQSVKEPFNDESYLTELKFDGVRCILSKKDNKINLYTRHNNNITTKFPELLDLDITNGTVLDGEIIVAAPGGKPDFEAVMERFQSKKSEHKIVYCVFDVIRVNDKSVAHEPLSERKIRLLDLSIDHPNVYIIQGMQGNAKSYFELVKEKSLEGIVLKKANSPYEIDKRSDNWLKVINYEYTDVYICGYTKDDMKFLLNYLDGSPAGAMEFMPINERKHFHSIKQIKFETKDIVKIEPIACRVKHRFKTKKGKLRIPSFESWLSK